MEAWPNEAVKARAGNTDAGGKRWASLPTCTMSAICSNSEGRKPEVSLTFNSRRRGEVVCAPRDISSGEDGTVGGGEHLRDGQIHFSGPSRSNEAGEALPFLICISGATRRSRHRGLFRRFKSTWLRVRWRVAEWPRAPQTVYGGGCIGSLTLPTDSFLGGRMFPGGRGRGRAAHTS